jgi:quinol-cytochrome oxidoreductase complex cytochrome b subunit
MIEVLVPLLVGTLVLAFQLPFADRLLAEFTSSPRPRERLLVRAIVVVIALAFIVFGVARLVSN